MSKISRREFVETTGAGLVIATSAPLAAQEATQAAAAAPSSSIKLVINGTEHRLEVEDRWTLVEVLRDHLGLTGTKIGCDRGECGACTVLLDGKPVYSCSQLAVWADGRYDTNRRGPGAERPPASATGSLHRARRPAVRLLHVGSADERQSAARPQSASHRDEVRAAMTGNICRCSNYNRYVESVLAAARLGSEAHEHAQDRRPSRTAHRCAGARHRQSAVHRRHPAARHAVRARPAQPASARAHPPHRRLEGAGAARR